MNLPRCRELIEKVKEDIIFWSEELARHLDDKEDQKMYLKIIDDKKKILNKLIVLKHDLKKANRSE